jgi:type I restriction enzyme S subunit
MKKYPAYKDCGIDWLGEIPEHWVVKELKYLSVNERYSFVDGPFGSDLKNEEYTDTGVPLQLYKHKVLPNDIVIAKMAEPVARSAKVKPDFKEYVVVADCMKFRPALDTISVNFLVYTMNGGYVKAQAEVRSTGTTRIRIGLTDAKKLKVVVPPLPEQQTIANYLDRKTHLIDTLIENKQKLIDLLKEQRTAIINQSVTIPEGWKPVKLKFLTSKIGSGVTPRGGSEVYQETGVPLLRSQNIYSDRLRLDEVAYISQEIHDSMNSSKVQHNDVLLNITGASIGRCYYVTEELGEANVNQHVCIIRPNERIKTIFLFNVLASTIGQFQVLNSQNGTSREGLNFEELGNFIIPLPPKTEQIKVIEFLDRASSKIFTSIDNLNNQMDHLQEYRTALISEVVTGKIDVRDSGEQEVIHS